MLATRKSVPLDETVPFDDVLPRAVSEPPYPGRTVPFHPEEWRVLLDRSMEDWEKKRSDAAALRQHAEELRQEAEAYEQAAAARDEEAAEHLKDGENVTKMARFLGIDIETAPQDNKLIFDRVRCFLPRSDR
jgi:kynurenine formamidase